jgi:uncharacterized protein YjaG (DUF416 family)
MHGFHYDEPATVARLEALPERLRVTFALLAASRIAPSYRRFHSRTGRGDAGAFHALVERLWRDLEGDEMRAEELVASVARAAQLIPPEDDGWDDVERAYAEDAAALGYAFRARMTGDPRKRRGPVAELMRRSITSFRARVPGRRWMTRPSSRILSSSRSSRGRRGT